MRIWLQIASIGNMRCLGGVVIAVVGGVMDSERGSVSIWLAGLKAGEQEAAQALWKRFSAKLLQEARHRFGTFSTAVADEEDIAQSVFHSLCRGAKQNRFEYVQDRDELWWLLLELTHAKVIDHIRRELAQKRGAGRIRLESSIASGSANDAGFRLDALIGTEPTPEFLAMLDDENRRLMLLLESDDLRRIASLRIEGFTMPEVAIRLEMSLRTVERKLDLIRRRWLCELVPST